MSQALGWKQGRVQYSLGVASSTGEEHWDCAAARHPHMRQAQLTRAQATQLRHREVRAQPTASFLKIQLRTRLALYRELISREEPMCSLPGQPREDWRNR